MAFTFKARLAITSQRAIVVSHVDYCNSFLTEYPDIRWLQSIMNAASRLLVPASRSDRTMPLHWLKDPISTEPAPAQHCTVITRRVAPTGS